MLQNYKVNYKVSFLGLVRKFFLGDVLCFSSGRESDFRQVLKPDGQEILTKAVSTIEAAVMYLEDKSITFQMLTLVRDNAERFLELCEQIEQIIKERSKEYLEKLLNQRIIELTAFEEERKKVSSFVRMCALITQGKQGTLRGFYTP